MNIQNSAETTSLSDWHILTLIATLRFIFHLLTNNAYGFHQDALAFIANGTYLDWGYVAYPPLTPFFGRIGLELFGPSLVGIKAFGALAQCVAMVVTGLMAKELGAGRRGQVIATLAAGIGLMSLLMGTLFQYITFDYLWWVLLLYCMLRMLKADNPRWWVAIGGLIGLGMMTKYTMIFLVAGIVLTVLVTRLRVHLWSRWLWIGVTLSLLIFLPNLIWQIQNQFVTLDFLQSISARDRAIGRADGFFVQQLYINVNPVMLPLAALGIWFYVSEQGRRFRPMLVIFTSTLLLFAIARGRFYYTAPLYPMLLAAGAAVGEQWLHRLSQLRQKWVLVACYTCIAVGGAIGVALMLPLAPVNSALWGVTSAVHDNFIDQIGWDELVATVAPIYAEESTNYQSLAIMTSHYGSASAFRLYGGAYNLPTAISPTNTYWYRGYGEQPPDAILAVGYEASMLKPFFVRCRLVGAADNQFGVEKENSELFLCDGMRDEWETIWPKLQRFS